MAKRFKITGSGKVLRRTPGRRHCLSAKTVKQKRASRADKAVSPGFSARCKQGMPFAH